MPYHVLNVKLTPNWSQASSGNDMELTDMMPGTVIEHVVNM